MKYVFFFVLSALCFVFYFVFCVFCNWGTFTLCEILPIKYVHNLLIQTSRNTLTPPFDTREYQFSNNEIFFPICLIRKVLHSYRCKKRILPNSNRMIRCIKTIEICCTCHPRYSFQFSKRNVEIWVFEFFYMRTWNLEFMCSKINQHETRFKRLLYNLSTKDIGITKKKKYFFFQICLIKKYKPLVIFNISIKKYCVQRRRIQIQEHITDT